MVRSFPYRSWCGPAVLWVGIACMGGAPPAAPAAASAEAGTATSAAPSTRPNVLFIAIDDLNDWTGFLGGHPQAKTPNLDALAKESLIFTRAYCSAPACNPSRASMLCGVRPSTSGVYHNDNPWRPQMPDTVTLFQHFMAHGYKVHGGGKLFHNSFNDLDSWEAYWSRPDDPLPPDPPLNGIPNAAHFDWGPLDADDPAMGDAKLTDWAADFLGQRHDRPFFLAVGYIRPHLPWYVPRKYFDHFPLEGIVLPEVKEDDLDDVPPPGVRIANPKGDHAKVLATNNWERAVQGYLASIEFVDGQVGRLLEAFRRSPYAKNTIVVLWGDHGWHLGEKLHWRKFSLWEEATRLPLVLQVPGVTRPGGVCERTVSLLDIYPTLCELADLPIPSHLEGDSIVQLLRDPAAEWNRPVVTTHGYQNHAVRSERWRYIRYADGSEELYDHDNDPWEWTNLADRPEYREVKAELAKWLPRENREEGPKATPGRQNQRRAARAAQEAGWPAGLRAYFAREWYGEFDP
ncbi:MAG: sulfatase [Thermogutta sp.]